MVMHMHMEVVKKEIDMTIIVEVERENEDNTPPVEVEEYLIKLQVISDSRSVRNMQLKLRCI